VKSKNKLITLITLLTVTILLAACSGKKPVTRAVTPSTPVVKPIIQPQVFHHIPHPSLPGLRGRHTVDDIVHTYGEYVAGNLRYYFTQAKVSYPPREITLLALKQEKKLELWARDNGEFRFIRDYRIMAASGEAGPKLRQGDRQVPEGTYRITRLNPNSNYYLSMKINYPNAFDLSHARKEGRSSPGSDIYIHGSNFSSGCLAMGDLSIEELFVLTAQVGAKNVKVVIAPRDPRVRPLVVDSKKLPAWTPELYAAITNEIEALSPREQPVKLSLSWKK
jgi:hypothetical protein